MQKLNLIVPQWQAGGQDLSVKESKVGFDVIDYGQEDDVFGNSNFYIY